MDGCRDGVPPQIAQRIMRHAAYRTTLKRYTSLQLSDDSAALAGISAPSSQGTKQDESVREAATQKSGAASA